MFSTLLAAQPIDLAIFGTLGMLWIGGAVFIVTLYRWILRFERGDAPHEDGLDVVGRPLHHTPPARAAREVLAQL